MATKTYLFDTNVLIEHIRKGNPIATRWIEKAARHQIAGILCQITITELWVGVKNQRHDHECRLLIAPFRKCDLNQRIAIRTAELWRPYQKDPGTPLQDFLIGATAEYYHADVVTTNIKHFRLMQLEDVRIINVHEEECD